MKQAQLKGNPVQGLAGATIGFFFGSAAVSLFGPSVSHFKEAMELTPAMVGFLVAIPSLSGSLLRIPFGAWTDSNGGKKQIVILLLLSVIGLGGLSILLNMSYPDGMAEYYPLVLLFGLLSGCGIATFSVGIGQTSYWFPQQRQGSALGLFGGVGTLAPGIFALLLPIYLNQFDFISAYYAWTIFLISGAILYIVLGKNAYFFQLRKAGVSDAESRILAQRHGEELFPKGDARQSLITSAKVSYTWILVTLYFTSFGGFLALTAWFHSYWQQYFGFSPVKAGIATALFSILSASVRIAGGSISDRIGGIKVCTLSMILLLTASACMTFSSDYLFSVVLTSAIAIAMGLNNAAVFKLVPKYVPQAIGGTAGWVGGLGAFGGFVIPPVMGMLVSIYGKAGYIRGFGVFVVLSAINLIIIYFGLIKQEKNSVSKYAVQGKNTHKKQA